MRTQEAFIGKVQPWRPDASRNHLLAAPKEVLVMTVEGPAIGEDKTGLALPSRSATSLGIIRRRGRDIAQMDEVQVGNVNAQLHSGGTDEIREPPAQLRLFPPIGIIPTEAAFSQLPLAGTNDLSCVLARFKRR
jgi:hypothetical protein